MEELRVSTPAVADARSEALLARLPVRPARITADSRAVERGVAFAAYPGAQHEGRAYIGDAIARGAAAVLWETRDFAWDARWQVPQLGVGDLKQRLGSIASAVYGHPSQTLWMIGVTGTNGKTSCAHWTAQAFARCGRRTAFVGTLGAGFIGALESSRNTTPDVCLLHEWLAQWRDQGAAAVAMEVSSHGLDQGRVNGIAFDVALFTNLTRDHLDYHGTMAAYGAAKARLFDWPGLQASVVNAGDAFGRELIAKLRGRGQRVVAYGAPDADIVAASVATTATGMAIEVRTPDGGGRLETRLAGAFNVQNLLGVLGVLLESGIALPDALAALANVTPPPGRMERLGGGALPTVVVDYAHSPDALEQVLTALRPSVGRGRLVCVFGCGGERDRGKRPQMGEVAGRLADRVVVTSDNPRGEDPQLIVEDIVPGLAGSSAPWSVVLDRAAASAEAIGAARAGDVVVLAGKGHEEYQEVDGRRLPFSDRRAAEAALSRRSPA
ncbi:MAG: UDP-N-acetylmuramoyl-L-alanyl-D-glutamate--2,6-diaminopimelate ligase [Betaproteobacteria bacterium]|nr:UDP-N-acetylmuramoyl-L-alanyl-D-glutamate--2,6-diaminopimelate ligase [Betaproteobacteria bacterium]